MSRCSGNAVLTCRVDSGISRKMVQSVNFRADMHWQSPRRVTVRCKVSGKTLFSYKSESKEQLVAVSNEIAPWPASVVVVVVKVVVAVIVVGSSSSISRRRSNSSR